MHLSAVVDDPDPIQPDTAHEIGTISMRYLKVLDDYLRAREVDALDMFEANGIPSAMLKQPTQRVGGARVAMLFDLAAERLDDAFFGLRLGQYTKPWHYDALGYLLISCETLGDALQQLIKYERLVSDVGETRVETEGESIVLTWDTQFSPYPPRHFAEENLASWMAISRWLSQVDYQPVSVHFQHAAPADISEHQALFRCPLYFNQARTLFKVHRSHLQLPLSQPDRALRQVLQARAETQLAQHAVSTLKSFPANAEHHLKAMLCDGEPDIEQLAERLHLSARTLQRRLNADGYTYKELLDQVRRRLALRYIENADLTLQMVSDLLGFSEQSAFQRAFKRWTHLSPGQYRQKSVNTPPITIE